MKGLKELLIKDEGLRLHPYYCPAQKVTIGVGRNLDDVGITKDEAMYLLDNDISRCIEKARNSFDWYPGLDSTRKKVIISMIFQIGLTGFKRFKKTIRLIKSGNYKDASIEMLDSKWATQTPSRAKRLSKMMAS